MKQLKQFCSLCASRFILYSRAFAFRFPTACVTIALWICESLRVSCDALSHLADAAAAACDRRLGNPDSEVFELTIKRPDTRITVSIAVSPEEYRRRGDENLKDAVTNAVIALDGHSDQERVDQDRDTYESERAFEHRDEFDRGGFVANSRLRGRANGQLV